MKILVIGFNTRHIVCSASRAGYSVYSLSNFNDLDLEACSKKSITQDITDVHNIDLEKLVPHINALLPVDFLVLGPGFEYLGHRIDTITDGKVPLLNNRSDIIARVSDKIWLAEHLKNHNIPHPFTVPLDSLSTPEDWAGGFPAIVKPRYGAGGNENILIKVPEDLRKVLEQHRSYNDQYLVQEYIRGKVASVSLISSGGQAVAIAVNEQLAGIPKLTRMPFAYCGNITPYISKHNEWLCDTAVNLAQELELMGSNGVDFIITDEGPVVLEINPRFQGSLDTVEISTGINIFNAHYNAFKGLLPDCSNYRNYSIKTIYFAPGRFIVGKKMNNYLLHYLNQGTAADVPPEGTLFEKDDPVVSFITTGISRNGAIQKARHLVSGLLDICNQTA